MHGLGGGRRLARQRASSDPTPVKPGNAGGGKGRERCGPACSDRLGYDRCARLRASAVRLPFPRILIQHLVLWFTATKHPSRGRGFKSLL